jgi:putative protein kinase ArgK-like GTPase of G3E family
MNAHEPKEGRPAVTEQNDNNQEPQEVSFYEKLAARTAELLEEGKKTLDEALKKAKDELTKAGNFTNEQADKVAEWVRRDVRQGAQKASDAVRSAIDPQRMAAGAQSIFARILTSTADTLNDLAKKTEQTLEFKTGEVTNAGTLTCKGCGAEMHMKKPARIPPCPKCHQTVFRKGY